MKKFDKIIWILVVLFWIWFIVSFIDVNINNLTSPYYLKYNFFEIFFNEGVN